MARLSRVRTMKPESPAIRVRGLGCYFGPQLEMDGVNHPREAWRTLLRFAGMDLPRLSDQSTQRTSVVGGYALRDVSLDIGQGSVVCLAGPAGAGKSVLLRILAGAMAPTAGRAEVFGSVSSLVGGGDLDEQSSAADNIRASAEFEATPPEDRPGFVSEVVDFAEINGFETAPLRTFSTGMRLRLNIALVLCSRSSILLLDALMSVGDIAFQQKCIERVRELAEQGRTIVAVFDDDAIVQQLATRVITMTGGRVVGDTSPASYGRHVTSGTAADVAWEVTSDLPEDDAVVMRALTVDAARNGGASSLDLTMAFEARLDGVRCRPSVVLNWGELRLYRTLAPQSLTLERGRRVTWAVRIPTDPLADGAYTLMVNMQSEHGEAVYAMKAHEAVSLSISRRSGEVKDANPRLVPLLTVQFPWEIETVEGGATA
jgi:ABC-type polysaccharide/polyol phosphate transport system ATPase subunit